MRITWLRWAGVEIEAQGERVLVDPLQDAAATFAWLGERAHAIPLPDVIAPEPGAMAGLLTHLHRDHADAGALAGALDPGATVYEPVDYGGEGSERLAIVQADRELTAAGLARHPVAAWTSVTAGPFTSPRCPPSTGPEIRGSHGWSRRTDGGCCTSVTRCGTAGGGGFASDLARPTWCWRPINGARLTFPHRRPASPFPGAMHPEQASVAAELLDAERLVPIHYGGYDVPGVYEPVASPLERLLAATQRATPMGLGETIDI